MNLTPSNKIMLDESSIPNAGRGVFATVDIKKNEVIELCPIILMSEKDTKEIRKTKLHNYYFMWGNDKENHKCAMCLGYGSLYNHSYDPNATYKKLIKENYIEFIAITDITKGEEITVNYNYGNPHDKSKLWIDSIPEAE